MAITREQATKKRELPKKRVEVPEWADENAPAEEAYVYVKTLSGHERDTWEESLSTGNKAKVRLDNIRAKLTVAVCVDDNGNQIFTDADVPSLGNGSCVPLGRVFDVAMKLNGIGKEHVDELVGE